MATYRRKILLNENFISPEGGLLYDKKVLNVYAFLRIFFFIKKNNSNANVYVLSFYLGLYLLLLSKIMYMYLNLNEAVIG